MGMGKAEIVELLPFWVNGSLGADEAVRVDAALQADPALASEAGFLRALRDRMQAEDPGFSPGELGLAKLRRAIAAQTPAPSPRRAVPLSAAVAAVVVAGLLAAMATQSFQPQAPAEYVQASGEAGMLALTVSFQPLVTAQALSQALLAEGLVIVDGPSALGLYRLAPFDPAGADLAAMAERLRARSDLIEMVDVAE